MEKINIKGNMLVKKRERKENVAKTIEEAISKTVEDFFSLLFFIFFFHNTKLSFYRKSSLICDIKREYILYHYSKLKR
jgi:hypothetical protein